MRPPAESPSNHPASVATAGAVAPLSSNGQSTVKLSSTYPLRHVPVTERSLPSSPDQLPVTLLSSRLSCRSPLKGPASVEHFTCQAPLESEPFFTGKGVEFVIRKFEKYASSP